MEQKSQTTYRGHQINAEAVQTATDRWRPCVQIKERWLCGTVERVIFPGEKCVFSTRDEATGFGLAAAMEHLDTDWAEGTLASSQ